MSAQPALQEEQRLDQDHGSNEAAPATTSRQSRPLRFITCGSVDDGKSTLIGRLLWDTKAVKDDQRATLEREGSRQNDLALPDFALLLDGLQAEREQGITIDVAYRYFSTEKRAFIVADTPGHEQYTRNMATGASTADLAVILVDATSGILTQTRRHARIAAMMGITRFVLAVNKFDLANYDRTTFEAIANEFRSFAMSLGVTSVSAIPMSGLKGENVVSNGQLAMPWYDGPTLLDALERAPTRSAQKAGFRMSVQRVARPDQHFRGFQGSVASGSVKPGDTVTILPSGEEAHVSQIVTFDLVRNAAVAGDAITLVLDRHVDVSRGDMIVSSDAAPMVGKAFAADAIGFSKSPVTSGKRYWLKSSSRRQSVRVLPLSVTDPNTGIEKAADDLPINATGKVELVFEEDAVFDRYADNRETGSFILIDPVSNDTVAAGMVTGQAKAVSRLHDSDDEVTLLAIKGNAVAKLLASLDAEDDVLFQERVSVDDLETIRRQLS